jgi:hypothetical protein
MWYMDDGTLGVDVTSPVHDFDIVKSVGSKLGLILNERKSELVTLTSWLSCDRKCLTSFMLRQ